MDDMVSRKNTVLGIALDESSRSDQFSFDEKRSAEVLNFLNGSFENIIR